MESRQQWYSLLKKEISNSPLVSNLVFGFILMVLEKLVELEFECPCNPKWNRVLSSAFFIIPAVTAFLLMLIIQGCRYGQYFACAMTDWEGRFVIVDKAAPQKWCEPNEKDALQKLMPRWQESFAISQITGMCLLMAICVGLVVYLIYTCCTSDRKTQNNPQEEREEENAAEVAVRMKTMSPGQSSTV
ncbi:calcium homeostasis modulator protein 6 [Xyrichtys novacula]|uniref:Calcium homeostasis modulator protein 6 n=1 Tax=Xyrichtys novacula TaxID=13765 RepID=A0AAV1EKA0_XYRNO|nr:calcium homeostasis modulator protein 6 [Xyrichtys novacula]